MCHMRTLNLREGVVTCLSSDSKLVISSLFYIGALGKPDIVYPGILRNQLQIFELFV